MTQQQIIDAGIDYTMSTCPVCMGGAAFEEKIRQFNRNASFEAGAEWMKNETVKSLDKIVTDALEFNPDNWADHLDYLDNALTKIQDMYEHDNW